MNARMKRTAVLGLLLFSMFGTVGAAHAATIPVDCGVAADDLVAVQGAVDAAAPGDTVTLSGTCDFSGATAARSPQDAAAFNRYPNPVRAGVVVTKDITIASVAAGATVQGSGDENAFVLTADADGATIQSGAAKNLVFTNLGNPIRVDSADGVEIANVTINGGLGTWAGIVASTDGCAMVRHGADANNDLLGDLALTPTCENGLGTFIARGNAITFSANSTAAHQAEGIVLIGATGPGVLGTSPLIENNTITHQGTAYGTFDAKGIGIWPIDATYTNALIQNNTITGPNQISRAAVGIVVNQTDGFTVRANTISIMQYRTLNQPQGGILVSDSEDGTVGGSAVADANTVNITLDGDDPADGHGTSWGGVGLVNDIVSLFVAPGGAPFAGAPEPTQRVRVERNSITTPGRGILLNGVTRATVTANTVATSFGPSLSIARPLTGGGIGSQGPRETVVNQPVSDSAACRNFLKGTPPAGNPTFGFDDTTEVSFGAVAGNANNSFPGGASFAGQRNCTVDRFTLLQPRLTTTDPTASVEILAEDFEGISQILSLTVDGVAMPFAPVGVIAGSPTSVTVTGTTPALALGRHQLVVRARDALGSEGAGVLTFTLVGTDPPPAPVITAPVASSVNPTRITAGGTSQAGTTVYLFVDGAPVGSSLAGASGAWTAVLEFTDGTHTLTARAVDDAGKQGPLSAAVSFVVDARAPEVAITSPQNLAVLPPGSSLSGTATDDRGVSRVEVVFVSPVSFLGSRATATCTGCPGGAVTWTVPAPGIPGPYVARVTAFDLAGNRSLSASVAFVNI